MRRSFETLSERQPVRSRLIRIAAEAASLGNRRERAQQVFVVSEIASPEHGLKAIIPCSGDAISILAAVVLLLVGQERSDRFIDWWMTLSENVFRVASVLAITFGAFFVYVAS